MRVVASTAQCLHSTSCIARLIQRKHDSTCSSYSLFHSGRPAAGSLLTRVRHYISFESVDAHFELLAGLETAMRCAPTLQRCYSPAGIHLPSSAALCAVRITHFSSCWEEDPGPAAGGRGGGGAAAHSCCLDGHRLQGCRAAHGDTRRTPAGIGGSSSHIPARAGCSRCGSGRCACCASRCPH